MSRFRLKTITGMSWRVLLANVTMLALAGVFATALVRELSRQQPIPGPPSPRPAAVAHAANAEAAPPTIDGEKLDVYNVIVTKHLFNPSRNEAGSVTAAATAAPPLVKPALHGVVVDGAASLAYLEDPGTNRVLMYRVGDSIAGGQLVKIAGDRVQIRRVDGPIDVLLNDPSKPKSAAPTATTAGATTGGSSRPVTSSRPAEVREIKSPPHPAVARRPVRTPRGLASDSATADSAAPAVLPESSDQ